MGLFIGVGRSALDAQYEGEYRHYQGYCAHLDSPSNSMPDRTKAMQIANNQSYTVSSHFGIDFGSGL